MNKRKRNIIFIVSAIIICFIFQILYYLLNYEKPYKYKESESSIESIELIYAKDSQNIISIKTLSEDDNKSFLKELGEIRFKKYLFGDPPEVSDYTVKINYSSGNYELISYHMAHYVKGENHYILRKHCDKGDLYDLILRYLVKENE